jgi:hypothetical protein
LPDEELEALGLKKPEIKRLRKVLAPRRLPLPLPARLALSYCMAGCLEGSPQRQALAPRRLPLPLPARLELPYWIVSSSYCMEGC